MKKILLVEDSPTQATRVIHFLRSHFDVVHANSGERALELAEEAAPEIVISDVSMPEMDGYQLCEALKGKPSLESIPVLLLTGLSDPEDIIAGLEAGADSYLTKPYDDDELLDRIKFVITNFDSEGPRESASPLEVVFLGKKHQISATRKQVLSLLLSIYESASNQNKRLIRVQLEQKLQIKQLKYDVGDLRSLIQHFSEAMEEGFGVAALGLDADGEVLFANSSGEEQLKEIDFHSAEVPPNVKVIGDDSGGVLAIKTPEPQGVADAAQGDGSIVLESLRAYCRQSDTSPELQDLLLYSELLSGGKFSWAEAERVELKLFLEKLVEHPLLATFDAFSFGTSRDSEPDYCAPPDFLRVLSLNFMRLALQSCSEGNLLEFELKAKGTGFTLKALSEGLKPLDKNISEAKLLQRLKSEFSLSLEADEFRRWSVASTKETKS